MAAPVTELVVVTVDSGPRFIEELRLAAAASSEATRFVIGQREAPAEALASAEPVVAVGQPVRDTCKEVVEGIARRTVPRESLVELTGPWLFSNAALRGALDRVGEAAPEDPLALCRLAGLRIHVILAG